MSIGSSVMILILIHQFLLNIRKKSSRNKPKCGHLQLKVPNKYSFDYVRYLILNLLLLPPPPSPSIRGGGGEREMLLTSLTYWLLSPKHRRRCGMTCTTYGSNRRPSMLHSISKANKAPEAEKKRRSESNN